MQRPPYQCELPTSCYTILSHLQTLPSPPASLQPLPCAPRVATAPQAACTPLAASPTACAMSRKKAAEAATVEELPP